MKTHYPETAIDELQRAAEHLTEAMRHVPYQEGVDVMTAHGIVSRVRARLEREKEKTQ